VQTLGYEIKITLHIDLRPDKVVFSKKESIFPMGMDIYL